MSSRVVTVVILLMCFITGYFFFASINLVSTRTQMEMARKQEVQKEPPAEKVEAPKPHVVQEPVHETPHDDTRVHAEADDGHHDHFNLGEILPLWSVIPFACMLLSIALLPLLAPEFWHHNFGKVSAFWAATMAIPFLFIYR